MSRRRHGCSGSAVFVQPLSVGVNAYEHFYSHCVKAHVSLQCSSPLIYAIMYCKSFNVALQSLTCYVLYAKQLVNILTVRMLT